MTITKIAIDLKNITVPVINIVGTEDDLVPTASSIPLNHIILSKDKKLIEFQPTHVESCISSYAHNNLWLEVIKWLQERSL